MQTQPSRQRLAVDPGALQRAEQLLCSYPEISDAEVKEVAAYLKSGPQMDIGLLSSNEAAWSAAERLRADHKALFATSMKAWLLWFLSIAAFFVVIAILWDSGMTK